MTCAECRDLLSPLVDDELAADERAEVEAHLAGCPECRRELERLRATVALVRGLEPVRAPAGFAERVLAAARPTPWPRRLARALFVPLGHKLPLEAAAVLLVAGLALLVFERTPEQRMAALGERMEQAPAAPGASGEAPPPEGETAPADAGPGETPGSGQRAPESARADRSRREAAEPAIGPARLDEDPEEGAVADDRPQRVERPAGTAPRSAEPGTAPADAQAKAGPASPPAAAPQREGTAAPGASEPRATAPGAPGPARAVAAGELVVRDVGKADRAVSALAPRLGGAVVRRDARAALVALTVVVPGERYAELAAELARLGHWRGTPPAVAPGVQVNVTIRILPAS